MPRTTASSSAAVPAHSAPHCQLNDAAVWLTMLKKRNTAAHIYDEAQIDDLLLLIRDSFIPAFLALEQQLHEKLDEVEDTWA